MILRFSAATSGGIHVPANPGVTSPLQETEQCGALRDAGSSPDHDDKAAVGLGLGQAQSDSGQILVSPKQSLPFQRSRSNHPGF